MACSRSLVPARTARGIALLAGLVLLATLSLLALVAANSMLTQQRIAASLVDAQAARENAELALSAGFSVLRETPRERRISGCTNDCFLPPTNGLIHSPGLMTALPEFESGDWWQAEGLLPGIDAITAESPDTTFPPWAEAPRFTIEEVAWRSAGETAVPPEAPGIDGVGYYRILGRGTGRQSAAVAVHEAIVARPWLGEADLEMPAANWREFCAPFKPWFDCGRLAWRARR